MTDGVVPELPEPAEPATTNATNEAVREVPVTMGKISPPPPPRPLLRPGQYCVKPGETLTVIAKKYGVSITTLKQLNGFDDKRADSLKAWEIIRVPVANTNAVNESRDSALRTKGRFPFGERSERP